ncbi:hypothetical protein SDC9_171249 [bioreactor metagenome]|uniref:Uncharacterized protein n=1 Tax=bioreactor metagenome TaxID=1076179 RepID=A0A645GCK3_9ZZZZ
MRPIPNIAASMVESIAEIITMFIAVVAHPMPWNFKVKTNGLTSCSTPDAGISGSMTPIESTYKPTRLNTVFRIALGIVRLGFLASHAARPMISNPAYENIMVSMLPAIPSSPPTVAGAALGCADGSCMPLVSLPTTRTAARAIKSTSAIILIPARYPSSLLSLSAPSRFNSVTPMMIKAPTVTICTFGIHSRSKIATAVASLDMASTIPVQYTQPTTNPAP